MSGPPQSADLPARAPGYIVGAAYDWLFFLAPPLLALGLGWSISGTDFSDLAFQWWDWEMTWAGLLIGIFIHAHLVLVFARSHGNRDIFARHKLRFLLVPVALYVAMLSSNWVIYIGSVVATFWDVYHSGMQTFGFGRIYDAKAGNDPKIGRSLDWGLNQLLYAGPIVAGAVMLDHFEDFTEFEQMGVYFFSEIPVWMEGNQRYLSYAILGLGAVYLLYYLYSYWRLHRDGHAISWQKVFLYTSTGGVSLYAWGFNSWGEAFFIMNFFHALQYFGLVWAMEKKNMEKTLRIDGTRIGKWLTLAVFLCLPLLYGTWVQYMDPGIHMLWAISLVVSLMHFWYDGFVWSVQKQQV